MPINGVLTIYHSRRDMYGHVYYAVSLANDRFEVVASGTIAADNVNTRECREQLGWHIERVEMPIRDYNRLVKQWPHYGCRWDEIKSNLVEGRPHAAD